MSEDFNQFIYSENVASDFIYIIIIIKKEAAAACT
jgi:hypothetical protein